MQCHFTHFAIKIYIVPCIAMILPHRGCHCSKTCSLTAIFKLQVKTQLSLHCELKKPLTECIFLIKCTEGINYFTLPFLQFYSVTHIDIIIIIMLLYKLMMASPTSLQQTKLYALITAGISLRLAQKIVCKQSLRSLFVYRYCTEF